MGQGLSCASSNNHENGIFKLAQMGDLNGLKLELQEDPSLLYEFSLYDRNTLLHVAAFNGQIHVVSWLLEQSVNIDALNRYKQTPLMLAVKQGKISCVEKLLHAGANILMFDSWQGRTCLHYAAYSGHSDCLKAILSSARTSHVALSWGFTRFVNIRDAKGATPLHLAASHRRPECVHILLDHGALVCSSTGRFGRYPGSTPLHLAARGGSLDCIRELLAWGADRLQRDESGRIPYMVALKHKHMTCAALLNPSAAEPLVWPSPLKFISELNPDAKLLLEGALMEANREREKTILKGSDYSIASPSQFDDGIDDSVSEGSDTELCCICFDQVCTIEVQDCGHRMCAHCTLALCCHNKPNPTTATMNPPVCPFCRSSIVRLVVAKLSMETDEIEMSSNKLRKSRKSWNLSEGSSSFKGFSGFGKMGARGSGRVSVDESIDKPNE